MHQGYMNTFRVGVLAGLALMSGVAWAGEVAKVISVTGTVYAQDASGQKRALDRKAAINEGDTVISEADANAQLRFIDGAVMSVRSSSQFKVDSYKAPTADSAGSSNISVAQGGFWTLTGSIAKQNPEDYKVKTNYATIGVRGTVWELLVEKKINYMGVYHDARDPSKTGLHIASRKKCLTSDNCEAINIGPADEFSFASVDSEGNVQGLPAKPAELNGGTAGAKGGARGGDAGGVGAGGAGGKLVAAFGGGAGNAAGGGDANNAGFNGANGNNIELVFFNNANNINQNGFLSQSEIANLTNVGTAASIAFPGLKTIAGLGVPANFNSDPNVVGFGIQGFDPNTTTRVLRQGGATEGGFIAPVLGGRQGLFGIWNGTAAAPIELYTDRNNPQTFVPIVGNVYFSTILPMLNPPLAGTVNFTASSFIIGTSYSGAITAGTVSFTYNVAANTLTSTDFTINTPSGLWTLDLTGVNTPVNNFGFSFTSFGAGTVIDGAASAMEGSVQGVLTGSGPGQRGLVVTAVVNDPINTNRFLVVTEGLNCSGLCP